MLTISFLFLYSLFTYIYLYTLRKYIYVIRSIPKLFTISLFAYETVAITVFVNVSIRVSTCVVFCGLMFRSGSRWVEQPAPLVGGGRTMATLIGSLKYMCWGGVANEAPHAGGCVPKDKPSYGCCICLPSSHDQDRVVNNPYWI